MLLVPTARWKALDIELNFNETLAAGGYSGSQLLPIICYTVAEARQNGINAPIYAGGGVFNAEAAMKLILSGSTIAQLGSLACCLGPRAISETIRRFDGLMDSYGYESVESMRGKAIALLDNTDGIADEKRRRVGNAYRECQVDADKCIGCGKCVDACWYEGIEVNANTKKAHKTSGCVGCGYCFSVCPTKALDIDAGKIVGDVVKK